MDFFLYVFEVFVLSKNQRSAKHDCKQCRSKNLITQPDSRLLTNYFLILIKNSGRFAKFASNLTTAP
ncbi:hypothetical protein CL634_03270 [bacterium]|nr:hypothetical protein [bacterium]